jgi:hypothetical protein
MFRIAGGLDDHQDFGFRQVSIQQRCLLSFVQPQTKIRLLEFEISYARAFPYKTLSKLLRL